MAAVTPWRPFNVPRLPISVDPGVAPNGVGAVPARISGNGDAPRASAAQPLLHNSHDMRADLDVVWWNDDSALGNNASHSVPKSAFHKSLLLVYKPGLVSLHIAPVLDGPREELRLKPSMLLPHDHYVLEPHAEPADALVTHR